LPTAIWALVPRFVGVTGQRSNHRLWLDLAATLRDLDP
jgi:hypothetical protein